MVSTSWLLNVLEFLTSDTELCRYIGDGILKLRDHPIWQYIPNLDWPTVRRDMGPYLLYDHLALERSGNPEESPEGEKSVSLLEIVGSTLRIPLGDMDPNVPLTSYGLDSLSARSLSLALQPIVSVTQLQLLADLSISDIERRIIHD